MTDETLPTRTAVLSTAAVNSLPSELAQQALDMARAARAAARRFARVPGAIKNALLATLAQGLVNRATDIAAANQIDVAAARAAGMAPAMIDRLTLGMARLTALADSVREIAAQPDPVGITLEGRRQPNGLEIQRHRVPLGVIMVIFESRPNVTVDVAALCLKAGSASILRGGSEAFATNAALHAVITEALVHHNLPPALVQLPATTDRELVGHLLQLDTLIDLVIPRGGEGLIRRVASQSRIPVIKHYRGNCHVYIDAAADLDMATAIVTNAKLQRVSVCNAAETLLVHASVANTALPRVEAALQAAGGCELRACPQALPLLAKARPATDADWHEEYLDAVLAVRVVESLDQAIDHINAYGSGHTEAIITRDLATARRFATEVDSASIMINASTRFADGGQYGLGAEVGISTDKLHARGPMGAVDLTTTRWIVTGDGHCRT